MQPILSFELLEKFFLTFSWNERAIKYDGPLSLNFYLVRSLVCSFVRSSFLPSFVRSFVLPSFLRLFVCSFLPSFVPSFVRSFSSKLRLKITSKFDKHERGWGIWKSCNSPRTNNNLMEPTKSNQQKSNWEEILSYLDAILTQLWTKCLFHLEKDAICCNWKQKQNLIKLKSIRSKWKVMFFVTV